jgi:hypothetical protein
MVRSVRAPVTRVLTAWMPIEGGDRGALAAGVRARSPYVDVDHRRSTQTVPAIQRWYVY